MKTFLCFTGISDERKAQSLHSKDQVHLHLLTGEKTFYYF